MDTPDVTDPTRSFGPDTVHISDDSGNIPVRNWFYMLLYAWDLASLKDQIDALELDAPDLRALLTKILAHYTRRQVRRGLRGDYVDRSEPLKTVRGRIDFTRTVGDLLLYKGELHCEYQEYSLNIPRNQIIASTLNRQLRHDYHRIETDSTAKTKDQYDELMSEVGSLVRTMSDIDRVRVSDRMIATEMRKLGRNEREYRLIMQICRWLNRPRVPEEDELGRAISDLKWARNWEVYERFVANFLLVHASDEWHVEPHKTFRWNTTSSNEQGDTRLPGMAPDIVLTHRETNRRIIIDTKWYQTVTSTYHDKEYVHNGNLYQMWAYLSARDHRGELRPDATGLLLYAETRSGESYLTTTIDDHPFRVRTINLGQDWRQIERDLSGIINEV